MRLDVGTVAGLAKKGRGFMGKEVTKGRWWPGMIVCVLSFDLCAHPAHPVRSCMIIMAMPTSAKQPAPMLTPSSRQRRVMYAEVAGGSVTWDV